LDAVDDLEERPRARLDDVGAHARPAVGALIVLNVDDRLALRILALRDAADLELPQHDADARGGLDRLESRIDRTITRCLALHGPAIRMLQLHHRRGGRIARCHGVQAGEAPGSGRAAFRAQHQRLEVAVEELLLLVGKRLEFLEYPIELGFLELEPERLHAVAEGMAAAVLAQYQMAASEAYVLGTQDLVRRVVAQYAVLMDSGLVGERVLAYHRFVAWHRHAGDAGNQP